MKAVLLIIGQIKSYVIPAEISTGCSNMTRKIEEDPSDKNEVSCLASVFPVAKLIILI